MVSGRSIGKKIGKTGKKIKKNISEKIGQYASPAAINEVISSRVASAKAAAAAYQETAESVAQNAATVAKQSLDQVLLNLEHRGLKIKESQDLINQLGQAVLTRAEGVRSQLSQNPLTPAWLKDLTCAKSAKREPLDIDDLSAEATSSVAEATVSVAAEGMQPKPMKDFLEEEDGGEAIEAAEAGEIVESKKTAKGSRGKSVPPKARAKKSRSGSAHASK